MNKIKKGDMVQILLGKDRKRSGKVERVFPKTGKILVEGVNKVKRHVSKRVTGGEGSIIEISKPLDISNVALVCPNCKKTTRVSFKVTGKEKLRICRRCKKEMI